jgi:hypothetical protein
MREIPATAPFVSAAKYEELQHPKPLVRRSRAIADPSRAEIEQMSAGRMSAEHDHLNALLDGTKGWP